MPTVREKRRTRRPRADELRGTKNSVSRASGLRVDLDRLDDDEVVELRSLVMEIGRDAEPDTRRDDPGYLDAKQRKRWEQLVEKAAGKPGEFDRRREDVKMNAKLTELAARANRPPRPPRLDQHGAVTLPQAVWQAVVNEELWVHDVGVLVGILAQLANGGLDGHVRVRGDALIADDQGWLFGTADPEGWLRTTNALRQLADGGWLEITKGRPMTIRRGSRLIEAMADRERESAA